VKDENKKNLDAYKWIRRLGICIVYSGALAGLIVAGIQIQNWRENREPILELFVPQNFTGGVTYSDTLPLNILVRIVNFRNKNAVLFFETMSVEVKSNGTWHKTKIDWMADSDYLVTNFPKDQRSIMGVDDIRRIKRFESSVITYDNPLSRYIVVTHKENESVLKNLTDIRVKVRDCHMKPYTLEVNLAEQQQKYDPDYKQIN
jgi:hypothetical protein